jgi:hypothetical protein
MRGILCVFAVVSWAAWGAAGCLSDPTPAVGDLAGEVDSAAALDAQGDAEAADLAAPDADGSAPTELPPVQVTRAFPPPAATLPTRIREVLVADLNGDGLDDLLLPNLPEDPAQLGVFVILGRAEGFGATYDAYVPTKARPDGLSLAQVGGDGRADLLTVGASGGKSWLQAHLYTGAAGEIFASSPLSRELTSAGFVPDGGVFPSDLRPVLLRVSDYTGDGVADVVAADLYNAVLVTPSAWTTPGVAQAAVGGVFGGGSGWDAIVGLYQVKSAKDDEYLLVQEQFGRLNYFAVDAGGLASTPTIVSLAGNQKGVAAADVDADGVDDVVGFNGFDLSVVFVRPPGGEQLFFAPAQELGAPDEQLDDVVAKDLDKNGAVDVVLLDSAESVGAARSRVLLVRDLYVDGPVVRSPNSVTSVELAFGFHPRQLAVGDFDGDGDVEVLAFDDDGTWACLDYRAADGSLSACR